MSPKDSGTSVDDSGALSMGSDTPLDDSGVLLKDSDVSLDDSERLLMGSWSSFGDSRVLSTDSDASRIEFVESFCDSDTLLSGSNPSRPAINYLLLL